MAGFVEGHRPDLPCGHAARFSSCDRGLSAPLKNHFNKRHQRSNLLALKPLYKTSLWAVSAVPTPGAPNDNSTPGHCRYSPKTYRELSAFIEQIADDSLVEDRSLGVSTSPMRGKTAFGHGAPAVSMNSNSLDVSIPSGHPSTRGNLRICVCTLSSAALMRATLFRAIAYKKDRGTEEPYPGFPSSA